MSRASALLFLSPDTFRHIPQDFRIIILPVSSKEASCADDLYRHSHRTEYLCEFLSAPDSCRSDSLAAEKPEMRCRFVLRKPLLATDPRARVAPGHRCYHKTVRSIYHNSCGFRLSRTTAAHHKHRCILRGKLHSRRSDVRGLPDSFSRKSSLQQLLFLHRFFAYDTRCHDRRTLRCRLRRKVLP